MTCRFAFRTDSSLTLSTGHLFRCLTLADALRQRGASVLFICAELPGNIINFVESKGHNVLKIPLQVSGDEGISSSSHPHWSGIDWKIDARKSLEILAGSPKLSWLIVDHYALDIRWEEQMRPITGKIMIIDDLADRPHDCDLLLDQNQHGGLERRYDGLVPDHCEMLLGPHHALLRPEFVVARKALRHRDGRVRRILVFFGGSDVSNETAKALEAIRLLNRPNIKVDVVVGASNPSGDQIREICKRMPNTSFHLQVENMAELMALADLAIGAGGGTTWERCYLGLPSLVLILADNQREVSGAMAAAGAMRNVGWHADVTSKDLAEAIWMALASPEYMRDMSERSLAIMGSTDTASSVERISDRMMSIHAGS